MTESHCSGISSPAGQIKNSNKYVDIRWSSLCWYRASRRIAEEKRVCRLDVWIREVEPSNAMLPAGISQNVISERNSLHQQKRSPHLHGKHWPAGCEACGSANAAAPRINGLSSSPNDRARPSACSANTAATSAAVRKRLCIEFRGSIFSKVLNPVISHPQGVIHYCTTCASKL